MEAMMKESMNSVISQPIFFTAAILARNGWVIRLLLVILIENLFKMIHWKGSATLN